MFACAMHRCSQTCVHSKHEGASSSSAMQHSYYSANGELCWLAVLHTKLRLPSPCKGILLYWSAASHASHDARCFLMTFLQ